MKKYIRNPRKKEMTNAYGELQDEGRNEEEEVQVHEEGVAEAKKMAKQTGGRLRSIKATHET